MERYVWKAVLREGMQEEYLRRHNEFFWPEMTDALDEAGIQNYSIWICGNELFGYFECSEGTRYAMEKQNESKVVQNWRKYMADILIREINPVTGEPLEMKQIFLHKGKR